MRVRDWALKGEALRSLVSPGTQASEERRQERTCVCHSEERWYRVRVRDRKEERKIKSKESQ